MRLCNPYMDEGSIYTTSETVEHSCGCGIKQRTAVANGVKYFRKI
jgi:hypothetical protein